MVAIVSQIGNDFDEDAHQSLREDTKWAEDENGNVLEGQAAITGLMSLLAGVLKFNSTLKQVTLANTGLDDASGAYFATSLLENKTLLGLDVSSNPIGTEGIALLANAARAHQQNLQEEEEALRRQQNAARLSEERGEDRVVPRSVQVRVEPWRDVRTRSTSSTVHVVRRSSAHARLTPVA